MTTSDCIAPVTDRPRERLWRLGAGALTSTELVAILLGTGGGGLQASAIATQLLERGAGRCGGSRGKLIVSIICDFGERYLSHAVYADMPEPDYSDVADALE